MREADAARQSRNLLFAGASRKAGFSTLQHRPQADNLAALEMTVKLSFTMLCKFQSLGGPLKPLLAGVEKLACGYKTRGSKRMIL